MSTFLYKITLITEMTAMDTRTASIVQDIKNLGTFIFQKGGLGSVVFVTKLIVLVLTVSS